MDFLKTFTFLLIFCLIRPILSLIQEKGTLVLALSIRKETRVGVGLQTHYQILDKFFFFVLAKFSDLYADILFKLLEDCRDKVTWIWDYNGEKYVIDGQDEVDILMLWFII